MVLFRQSRMSQPGRGARERRCNMMTVKQVAERLGISLAQVYALCSVGRLPCHRFGKGKGAIRVKEEDLDAFVEASRFKPPVELPALVHIQLHDGQRPAGAFASH